MHQCRSNVNLASKTGELQKQKNLEIKAAVGVQAVLNAPQLERRIRAAREGDWL